MLGSQVSAWGRETLHAWLRLDRYTLATLLSFYNKLLLGHDTVWHVMGEPFPAPLFMSGVQFAMQVAEPMPSDSPCMKKYMPHTA
eukprot:366175-Chlamydomonas_euryale.AAC.8